MKKKSTKRDVLAEIFCSGEVKHRQNLWDCYFASALAGMLGSAPMCDRTKIKRSKWCRIAGEWADEMMHEHDRQVKRKARR